MKQHYFDTAIPSRATLSVLLLISLNLPEILNYILFLRYEDLIREGYKKQNELFRFIGADFNIPDKALREDDSRYQNWRLQITQDRLDYAERRCSEVITRLGFNLFTTVDRARNFSHPLFIGKE